MPDGEIQYSFRRPYPNVYQRGRDQTAKLEAYRDGVLTPPTVGAGSTFTLIAPDGSSIVGPKQVTVVDEIATAAILATEIPDADTTVLSELYQERWILLMPDGTTRTVRREAAIARFLFQPNISDVDLVEGEYPDLLDLMGEQDQTLQPFIDGAVRTVLQKLFASGQWPDLLLSADAFYEPIRQLALFRIFKWLFRQQAGNNRWEILMNHHESEWKGALKAFTSRVDYDHDGLPDSRGRWGASTVIHKNANYFRRQRRTARW